MNLSKVMLALVSRYLMFSPIQYFKWRAFRLGLELLDRQEGFVEARMTSGERFKVLARDYAGGRVALTGQWEPAVTAMMRHLLREGDVFVDIGANFGYFSIAAAGWVGRKGKVISFECAPRALELLRANVASNCCEETVEIFACGLGDISGNLKFYQSRLDTGWSSLDPLPDSDEICVPICRFDTLQDLPSNIRLIKIDVEGGESRVLQGMHGFFSRGLRPIVIAEMTPRFADRGGASVSESFSYLSQFGYSAFVIPRLKAEYGPNPRKGFMLKRVEASDIEQAGNQEDIIFVCRNAHGEMSAEISYL